MKIHKSIKADAFEPLIDDL